MAKGLAVISGSNTVMFKALETGIITAGTSSDGGATLKPATFTLTGSLLISGSTTNPTMRLEGLTLVSTSSVATDTILIKTGTLVKEVTVLSGNQVVLQGGQNVEQRINDLESNLGASALTVSSSTSGIQVDLDTEVLKIVGTANEIEVGLSQITPSSSAQFQVGLPDAVEIKNSLFITGSAADVLKITTGNIKVSSGQISSSGDIYTNSKVVAAGEITGSSNLKIGGSANITNNLTVGGDLTVNGNVTVLDTTNLRVEDPIIVLGSGSGANTTGDKGFVFATSASANQAFIWDGQVNKFILGSTLDDGTGTNINVTSSAAATSTLVLHTLEATDLDATGNVTLGNAGTDRLTINSYITGSGSPIVVSSSLTIGAANNVATEVTTFVSQVKMPIFSVSGTNAVGIYPQVPELYGTNPSAYSGHMFYLTSSNTTGTNEGDNEWDHANKWYFNERGVWHEMPFFYVP